MDSFEDSPASVEELLARHPAPWSWRLDPAAQIVVVDAVGQSVCIVSGPCAGVAADFLIEQRNATGAT